PRKNVNGETSMRPYRIGTSSGTRVCACSSRSSTGSRRSRGGSHSPWVERDTSPRAVFPRAARSCGVRCCTTFGLALRRRVGGTAVASACSTSVIVGLLSSGLLRRSRVGADRLALLGLVAALLIRLLVHRHRGGLELGRDHVRHDGGDDDERRERQAVRLEEDRR